MVKRLFTYLLILAAAGGSAVAAQAAEKPSLVINITIGSLDAQSLVRYSPYFGERGIKRLLNHGAVFTEARYDHMPTTTAASLATLSTGATPAIHGAIASRWFDRMNNRPVSLIDDENVTGISRREGKGQYSPARLTATTLSDALHRADGSSRIITIAAEPLSAIVTAGRSGLCFWIDEDDCRWTSSSFYMEYLPSWVSEYNRDMRTRMLSENWTARYSTGIYQNTKTFDIVLPDVSARDRRLTGKPLSDIEKINRTPAGTALLFDFAKCIVRAQALGADSHPDILNICIDASRNIVERYGYDSVEYEDMLYRLDSDLADFLDYVFAFVRDKESVAVILTSDHGSSPVSVFNEQEQERFNARQFEVITNAYLGGKFGQGDWVVGYTDRALYINRLLAEEKRIPVTQIQNEAARFATRFRGVSHALSADMLTSNSYAGGCGRKMQNAFYPRRSGDVIINLMPERIEITDDVRSASGSMYDYDTHVPLIIFGAGTKAKRYDHRVDMTSVAPTIAHMLGIAPPTACEGTVLNIEKH